MLLQKKHDSIFVLKNMTTHQYIKASSVKKTSSFVSLKWKNLAVLHKVLTSTPSSTFGKHWNWTGTKTLNITSVTSLTRSA